MPCTLCGLPLPKPPVSDAGHDFCCIGCREVYKVFGEEVFAARKVSRCETAPAPEGREAFLWIDGMHCASCEFLTEKLALKIPGVLAAAKAGHRKPYRARAMNIDFSMGDVVQP